MVNPKEKIIFKKYTHMSLHNFSHILYHKTSFETLEDLHLHTGFTSFPL